ncbi:MAG: hypothetical protein ACOYN1_07220 [Polynucleobacter sp.]
MSSCMVLEESTSLIARNQPPKSESSLAHHSGKYSYVEAIAQLKDCGQMSLVDMQKLSHADLNNVFEEIKCWCVYGNQNPAKLRAIPNAHIKKEPKK